MLATLIPGGILLGISIAIAAGGDFPPIIAVGVLALLANVILSWAYLGAPLYMFCVPLILDRKLGAIEAMQDAWARGRGHSWGLFGALFVLGLINLGGVLFCFVGTLFTIPFTTLAHTAGYLLIAGRKRPLESPDGPRASSDPGEQPDDYR
jgi:uncharacterized membrane protein